MADRKYLTEKEAQGAYDSQVANVTLFAGKISELCKYVWAGALAIFYALITTDPAGPANKFLGGHRSLLFVAAAAGALAFLFDYLQNFCAYKHALSLARWLESEPGQITVEEQNRRTSGVYLIANAAFFYAKNFAVLVTASLLVYVILASFLK